MTPTHAYAVQPPQSGSPYSPLSATRKARSNSHIPTLFPRSVPLIPIRRGRWETRRHTDETGSAIRRRPLRMGAESISVIAGPRSRSGERRRDPPPRRLRADPLRPPALPRAPDARISALWEQGGKCQRGVFGQPLKRSVIGVPYGGFPPHSRQWPQRSRAALVEEPFEASSGSGTVPSKARVGRQPY
jgi:hypothetical protein